ncbi:hypothetical protein O3S80_18870 [Streptomyces sp. Lzd4kr]|nr:hypothetical protein [Streptomyces sp. Lzd4kr]
MSQFLSPLVNGRTDAWGGSLENRARMLLDVVRDIGTAVEPSFAVAVKPNAADFQRGGFDVDHARRVIAMLAPLGVDLGRLSNVSPAPVRLLSRPHRPGTDAGGRAGRAAGATG